MTPIVRFLCAALLLVCASCRHAPSPESPSHSLQVGAAELDITPPPDYRMAGYFDERLATGTHDPLKAKALVLQQGKEKMALVFCDLLGITLDVSSKARADASRQTGIPVSHIVVSATHSHTGPLLNDLRFRLFHEAAIAKSGSDPHQPLEYDAFLTRQIVSAIIAAHDKLQPAELAVGLAQQDGLNFNRRFWMKNGTVAFNPGILNSNIVRPAGPTDPEVGILLARKTSDSLPFAGATIFALHSDTVGGTLYSADYEFFLQQRLRAEWGTNFISAFGAGTCGDLNHIDVSRPNPLKGFANAEKIGSVLGQTVLNAAPQLATINRPTLAVESKTIRVPLQKFTPEELADAQSKAAQIGSPKADFTSKVKTVKILELDDRGPDWPMEVQAFRFDNDTALVCLPGEIFVELGLAIKKSSPFKRTLVMEICNDRPSYVPTRKAFAEGSYEIINSRVEPGTGEQLVEVAVKLLTQLKP